MYDQIGPIRTFIVDDRAADPKKLKELAVNGVVKRVFVQIDDEYDIAYCPKC